MNIIYLVSDLRAAGPTNQAYNLMTGLAKLDCKVTLVTLYEEHPDSWMDRFVRAGVKIHQLHSDHKHLRKAIHDLEVYIEKNHIDILHSSGMSADMVNRAVKSNVIKIDTIRQEFGALGEESNFIIKFINRYITLRNHKSMDVRVACSKALQAHLVDYAKLDYKYVENGVDTDKYMPIAKAEKRLIRENLGISPDAIVLVTVGVLYTRKQTLALAKTFVECNLPNAFLVVVGDGVEMNDLKTVASENPCIKLIGKVQDPLQYYQCADMFVSASLAEGLPNTVLEAMACGLTCVLSDIGPHKEILEYDMGAGSLFKTKDYEDLKHKLSVAVNWDIEEKSQAAQKLIAENLSKYCTASNYYKLYKEAYDKKS